MDWALKLQGTLAEQNSRIQINKAGYLALDYLEKFPLRYFLSGTNKIQSQDAVSCLRAVSQVLLDYGSISGRRGNLTVRRVRGQLQI